MASIAATVPNRHAGKSIAVLLEDPMTGRLAGARGARV
jgi:hypothetical protein